AAHADRNGRAEVRVERCTDQQLQAAGDLLRNDHGATHAIRRLAHRSSVSQVEGDAVDAGLVGYVVDLDDRRIADPLRRLGGRIGRAAALGAWEADAVAGGDL